MERNNVIVGRVERRRRNQTQTEELSEHARRFMEFMTEKEKEKEKREKRKVDVVSLRAEIRKGEIQYEAERIRRNAFSPLERLREDGQELQQKIETDHEMLVTLELSASERAKCRAEEDCLQQQTNRYRRIGITDKYRICLHGVENQDWFGRRKSYYHVRCFSQMVDLHALIPSKLKLDSATKDWPLMVQKWYQHKGHIDLDKIAAYIDEQEAYVNAIKEEKSAWETHMQSCTDEEKGECKCPQSSTCPPKPILESFAGGTDIYELEDVLKHRNCRYGALIHLAGIL